MKLTQQDMPVCIMSKIFSPEFLNLMGINPGPRRQPSISNHFKRLVLTLLAPFYSARKMKITAPSAHFSLC